MRNKFDLSLFVLNFRQDRFLADIWTSLAKVPRNFYWAGCLIATDSILTDVVQTPDSRFCYYSNILQIYFEASPSSLYQDSN